jgi:hypothetical protein
VKNSVNHAVPLSQVLRIAALLSFFSFDATAKIFFKKALQALGIDVNIRTTITYRLIRVELKTGEVEVLLTTLTDKKRYGHEHFGSLYNKRWGLAWLRRTAAQIYHIPLGFGVFWGGVFWRIGRLNLMRLLLCTP